jgi:hypothetical protein
VHDRSGGVDFQDDVSVQGDVAGRDVVRHTTVGYGPQAVQRLIITVGVLVFVTAACFFSGGVLIGSRVFAAFDRLPVDASGQSVQSSPQAAREFQAKVNAIQSLAPGQAFQFSFSEDELSSYINFQIGADLGLHDGKARFIEPGLVAIGGQMMDLGNLNAVATFRVQENAAQPLRLESAAVQLLSIRNSTFGWVSVPAGLLAPLADRANALLGDFVVRGLQARPGAPQWTVLGQAQ